MPSYSGHRQPRRSARILSKPTESLHVPTNPSDSGFYWLRVVEVEPKSFEIRADVDFQQPVHFAVQVSDSAHL